MRLWSFIGPVRWRGGKTGIFVILVLGYLLAIAGVAPASDPGRIGQPPLLSAKRGDAVVTATLGTYCWKGVSSEICVDDGYPLPIHKRLAVSPGDRVSLRIGVRAARVTVSLLHVAGDAPIGHEAGDVLAKLRSNPASPSRRRWATKLPSSLKTANVLDVSVQYANNRGDADFWVGLRATENGGRDSY